MKDRFLSFLKEQWFRVLLLFITISFIPLSVTAEYKGQSNIMKRVVAASESQKMRFSSNKLVQSSTPVYSVEYKYEFKSTYTLKRAGGRIHFHTT